MFDKKILVIDDSETVLKTIKTFLEIEGFDVIVAHSGTEGFKIAKDEIPDLILTDFVMPNLNGFHLAKLLHADSDTKDIPVILISSKGEKVGDKFKELTGIVDYLVKPFSTKQLKEKIDNLFG